MAVLLAACDPPVQEKPAQTAENAGEQFIKANQYMQRRHQDHIAAFVERMGWKARVTATGLWLVVETPGAGEKIGMDKRVTYSYQSMLLDGTPCYEAGESDPKIITIGKGGVESGVEEGLQMLQKGSVATLIIPPHLAHGNFGDRDKIPGNTVIIYHVKIIDVQ